MQKVVEKVRTSGSQYDLVKNIQYATLNLHTDFLLNSDDMTSPILRNDHCKGKYQDIAAYCFNGDTKQEHHGNHASVNLP